jgi:nicotinamidase-related amidase
MRGSVLVVDMVKDTFVEDHPLPITPYAEAIAPRIDEVTRFARERGWPVIFACDSFVKDDFIFEGKMRPHSLRGTAGSEVTDRLEVLPGDVYLPKRRFSAFFKTDLDTTLRTAGVDTAIVCGISSHICVLATTLDAICHDFSAILVEDATAAFNPEIHERTLENYRRNPLYPLLRVMTAKELFDLEG